MPKLTNKLKAYYLMKIEMLDKLISNATSPEQKVIYEEFRQSFIDKLPKSLDPDLAVEKAEALRLKEGKAELRRIETEKRKAEEKIQKEKIAAEKKKRLEQKAILEAELKRLKEQESLEEVMEILEPEVDEISEVSEEPESEEQPEEAEEPESEVSE